MKSALPITADDVDTEILEEGTSGILENYYFHWIKGSAENAPHWSCTIVKKTIRIFPQKKIWHIQKEKSVVKEEFFGNNAAQKAFQAAVNYLSTKEQNLSLVEKS